MMNELQIDNFVKIIETSKYVNARFIDWNITHTVNTSQSSYPSSMLSEVTVKVDKDYNENVIVDEFIEKLIEICDTDTYNERVYEHKTVGEIKSHKEMRRLVSRMVSCGNYIAMNGRVGPAQFVLVPYYYYYKLSNFSDGKIGGMELIPTYILSDTMIFGRKNDENQSGIFLFLDKSRNKYNLSDVGDAQHQYHILKITNLQDERKKKLLEIENKK